MPHSPQTLAEDARNPATLMDKSKIMTFSECLLIKAGEAKDSISLAKQRYFGLLAILLWSGLTDRSH